MFYFLLDIFFLHGNFTISSEGLQSIGLCLAPINKWYVHLTQLLCQFLFLLYYPKDCDYLAAFYYE